MVMGVHSHLWKAGLLMGVSLARWGRQQLDGRKVLLSPVLQASVLKR